MNRHGKTMLPWQIFFAVIVLVTAICSYLMVTKYIVNPVKNVHSDNFKPHFQQSSSNNPPAK